MTRESTRPSKGVLEILQGGTGGINFNTTVGVVRVSGKGIERGSSGR